jgi:hypothetical protein
LDERSARLYALIADTILCQLGGLAPPGAPSSPALRA